MGSHRMVEPHTHHHQGPLASHTGKELRRKTALRGARCGPVTDTGRVGYPPELGDGRRYSALTTRPDSLSYSPTWYYHRPYIVRTR